MAMKNGTETEAETTSVLVTLLVLLALLLALKLSSYGLVDVQAFTQGNLIEFSLSTDS